ncbi:hypothetical protein G7077_13255 [Sphingomonas piscis]|uniref:Spore coat protein U domain-containing protein n=1 Tax=Sphingomonas piscis TaxID=2714943 RepID=A0A6G7YSL0_9SPHN|nr:hypothetical protein [Sphingomonas piscis]QIK79727.1 hypothetical protein G7077_13255 [Sphingomonas piscis]
MNFNRFSAALLASASLFSSGAAQAATQGNLAATSQGTVQISASVATRVQITGLSDVTFSSVDPGTAASNNQNVCVWSNTATRGYNITATGNGASSAFTLASASLPVVPYSVEWAGSSGQTSGTALTKSTALTGLTSTATRAGCASGPTSSASLIVKMATADLQSMTAGASYTGTLTLVVAPE